MCRRSRWSQLFTILGASLVWWNAADIVRILFGPGWEAMIFPLQILGLGLVPRASFELAFSLTRAMGKVRIPALLQWVYAVEVVVGALIGSAWGISGVAVGTTIAVFVHHTAILLYMNRCLRGLLPHMIRMYLRLVPLILVANIAGAAVAARVSDLSIVLRVAAVSSAIVVVAAGVVWLLRKAFEVEIDALAVIASSVLNKR